MALLLTRVRSLLDLGEPIPVDLAFALMAQGQDPDHL